MVDRPAGEWPRKPDGSIAMTVAPFDVEALVADAF
jgi:catechol-2,3-dioxygenase